MGLKPDKIRPIAPAKIEIRFVADEALTERLDKVRGLLAHTGIGQEMGRLIEKLCEIAIEKLRPMSKSLKHGKEIAAPLPWAPKGHCVTQNRKQKSLPARLRAMVWARAKFMCEKCGSTYALQIDHIHPKAKGGTDDPANLRLLCRNCNQRAAIEKLGLEKMAPYLSKKDGANP